MTLRDKISLSIMGVGTALGLASAGGAIYNDNLGVRSDVSELNEGIENLEEMSGESDVSPKTEEAIQEDIKRLEEKLSDIKGNRDYREAEATEEYLISGSYGGVAILALGYLSMGLGRTRREETYTVRPKEEPYNTTITGDSD